MELPGKQLRKYEPTRNSQLSRRLASFPPLNYGLLVRRSSYLRQKKNTRTIQRQFQGRNNQETGVSTNDILFGLNNALYMRVKCERRGYFRIQEISSRLSARKLMAYCKGTVLTSSWMLKAKVRCCFLAFLNISSHQTKTVDNLNNILTLIKIPIRNAKK